MNTIKNNGIRLAVLLVSQAFWLSGAHGQSPADAPFSTEISRQESIYQSKGDQVPTGYSINRSLAEYTRGLAAEFSRDLAMLGPQDRWLDIGAGQGLAILDYYTPEYDAMHAEGRVRRGKKAKAVALSIEDRRTPVWHQAAANLEANQIQYLFARRLEEYRLEELGKFRLITDLLGGFSYTNNLSLFLEKTLGFLEVNGSFSTVLQDVGAEDGLNRPFYSNARFLTEILNVDASNVKVCAWLKSITCVQVTCELRTDWRPPIEVYRIRKDCDNVTVPELVAVHYEAGTPPERRFQLRKPLPVQAEQKEPAR